MPIPGQSHITGATVEIYLDAEGGVTDAAPEPFRPHGFKPGAGGNTHYQYDHNGNLTSDAHKGMQFSYNRALNAYAKNAVLNNEVLHVPDSRAYHPTKSHSYENPDCIVDFCGP